MEPGPGGQRPPPPRILVLRGGALGDFIVTLPALQLLRARWPEARIALAGNATAAELGRLAGCLDSVHSQHEARWSALYSRDPLPPPFQEWLATFDLVLSFWPDPDGTLAAHFPLHRGQTCLSAPALPTFAPAARHYCEPLRSLGLVTTDLCSRLPLPRPAFDVIALHAGSGSREKNWPLDRWRAFLEQLNRPLLIIGGEADAAAIKALAPFGEVFGGRPLAEVAGRLAGCRGFVGHDSGISHLAAAVGTPCVLLFGPTDPAIWAPRGDHVQVVRRGASLGVLSLDEVLERTNRHFFADQTGPA